MADFNRIGTFAISILLDEGTITKSKSHQRLNCCQPATVGNKLGDYETAIFDRGSGRRLTGEFGKEAVGCGRVLLPVNALR
jgi:hypothetical protein